MFGYFFFIEKDSQINSLNYNKYNIMIAVAPRASATQNIPSKVYIYASRALDFLNLPLAH